MGGGGGDTNVPLISSYMLSRKKDKKAWVEVVRDALAKDGYYFEVKTGEISKEEEKEKKLGTKASSDAGRTRGFSCVLTGAPMSLDYIRSQGQQQKLGVRLMAIVAKGKKERIYLSPTKEQEAATEMEKPKIPELDTEVSREPRSIRTPLYGMMKWSDHFTARQLTTLQTFSELVGEAREKVLHDAHHAASLPEDSRHLADGGIGATAYADGVATYLTFLVGKMVDRNSILCSWQSNAQKIRAVFGHHALKMVWDFSETNPFSSATGSFEVGIEYSARGIEVLGFGTMGSCHQVDASQNNFPINPTVIATDPPYYDNIDYAVLSDFFYVWLRLSLRHVWPSLFRRTLTPKKGELIASAYRHGDKQSAENFFMEGMSNTFKAMHDATAEGIPITIYYAFKQAEVAKEGRTSAGWASFLQAVINAGFIVDGTWPVRTEMTTSLNAIGANALASSIVLVCVKRSQDAPIATRREFILKLKKEMSSALKILQDTKIRPVDMAQASIGPGIGVFSQYAKILKDDDSEMTVRDAIARINEVRDEILSEEDAEYDSQTRFCIDWFQSFGIQQGDAGTAITMAQAYNLRIEDLESAGVFLSKRGRASLIKREEMPSEWSPDTDNILTHWECTQHLIRVLQDEHGGVEAAGTLLSKMDGKGDTALKLAHRLYHICEQKNWMQEAVGYNQLAQEFSSIEESARRHQDNQAPEQAELIG